MSHTAKIEVVTRAERRRWSSEEKLRIVRETLEEGASVSVVARRHRVASNLLYTWRRRALAGAVAGFAPIEIAKQALIAAPGQTAGGLPKAPGDPRRGGIEVVLTNGCRVRIDRGADMETLRGVLAAIGVR